MGPAVSWLCAMGTMPDCDDEPERRLDADHEVVAGRTDDRPVGLGADRAAHRLAAAATAEPDDEPQGSQSRT